MFCMHICIDIQMICVIVNHRVWHIYGSDLTKEFINNMNVYVKFIFLMNFISTGPWHRGF